MKNYNLFFKGKQVIQNCVLHQVLLGSV